MTFNFGETFNINGANGDKSGLTFFNDTFWINKPSTPTPGWKDVTVTGEDSLNLPNAKADGLNYVKAFGATEQRNLPSGYTQVEYLQSTGTQYINTGVNTGENIKLKYKFRYTAFSGATFTCPIAARVSNISDAISLGVNVSYTYIAFGNKSERAISSPLTTNIDYTVIMDKTSTIINGTSYSYSDTQTTTFNKPLELVLFARNNNGSIGNNLQGRIYNCQILDNIILIQNLIPCRRNSDNVLGMYDTVTDTFFTNAGTGTFTAGPDVTTPSPDTPMDIQCNNGTIKVRSKSGLPDGYVKLNYLESSGTQYLKLGINDSNPNLEIEATFSDIGGSGYRYILGCWSNDDAQNTVIYINNSNQTGAWVCKAFSRDAMIDIDITEKHTVKVNKDAYYLDGNLATSEFTPGVERTGAELYAFKRNGTDGSSPQTTSITGKIHNISFKDNGVFIRNFIPARRNSDNELGMYDLVNNTFLTNAGTGTFTGGGIDGDDIEIYIDGTTETIKDSLNNTATAENLLSAGTYKDVQSILDGTVTRNIGIKVLNGTENWAASSTANLYSLNGLDGYDSALFQNGVVLCTHFVGVLPTTSGADMPNYSLRAGGAAGSSEAVRKTIYIKYAGFSSVNDFKQWLASQYSAGTPVIIVYPLATPTTETVTAQTLTTKSGDNTIEITQASLGDLTLEAQYQAGVTVTIEEVEEANLDNNVTVVIS